MATKNPNWLSGNLSDSDFVCLSETYFDRQIWDLHTAICLWAKIDPASKKPSDVNTKPKFDGSISLEDEVLERYLKVSLEAIQCSDAEIAESYGILRLPSISCPSNPSSSDEILLNPRHFTAWAEKRYEGGAPHLTQAETAYQKRKASKKIKKEKWGDYKKNAAKYAKIAHEEFITMVEEDGIDLKSKGIVKPLAEQLFKRLSKKIENPYKINTLRSQQMIPSWVSEYLSQK